jgi:tetratricopeptide (TPR) repeat protein
MKRLLSPLAILISTITMFAQTNSSFTEAKLSPAERSIVQAGRLIEKNPKNYEAYNALALAQSRRARETSDQSFYDQAEETLRKSVAISPGNFDGERIQVLVLLGRHEFATAREEAQKLNKRVPDDVMVYGFLSDANAELGKYEEAEKAAQLMLDLRAGNLPALTRAAYLRELFGDVDGALELMQMALESTPPGETEDQAWILSQIGHLQLSEGKLAKSEDSLQRALSLFPGYCYALGYLGKLKVAQGKYDEAVSLLRQRYRAAPHAENGYDLGEALELAGQSSDAKKAFLEFEGKSLLETHKSYNSNRELIFYYADHAKQPAQALEVAQREFAHRHDVYTLDAYAWALHVNGRDEDARTEIGTALAVGIRDANLFRHAGAIALALGDRAAAQHYLTESSELKAPGSEQAKMLLATLGAKAPQL